MGDAEILAGPACRLQACEGPVILRLLLRLSVKDRGSQQTLPKIIECLDGRSLFDRGGLLGLVRAAVDLPSLVKGPPSWTEPFWEWEKGGMYVVVVNGGFTAAFAFCSTMIYVDPTWTEPQTGS